MTQEMAQSTTVNRKARVGTVVSDINDQTIVVEVERAARHRLYRKVIRHTKKYHVHDANNEATRGDLVRIEECRPISKLKRWRLVEILTERAVAEVAPEAIGQEIVEEVQRSAARAAADEAAPAEGEAPVAEVVAEAPAAEAATEVTAEAPAEVPAAEAATEAIAEPPAAEPPAAEASDDADDTAGDDTADEDEKAE
jgi:small subunit ribosomal protein S17